MKVGQFVGKAVGVNYGRTANGNEYIAVALQCGDEMGTWLGYLNTDDNVDRTLAALRCMGWSGSDAGAVTLADLPGYVQVDVRQDKDRDGNPRVDAAGNPIGRPAFINPITGRQVGTPLDAGARKSLGLRLRSRVAAAPVVAPTLSVPGQSQQSGSGQPTRQPGDDGDDAGDEIPF